MDKDMSKITDELVLASSAASVLLSVYLYAKGKREAGIFVGLWAPTILGMGAFVKAGTAANGSTLDTLSGALDKS